MTYLVCRYYSYEGYSLDQFATLEEALESLKEWPGDDRDRAHVFAVAAEIEVRL